MIADHFLASPSAFGYDFNSLCSLTSSGKTAFLLPSACSLGEGFAATVMATDSLPNLFYLALFTEERGFMPSPGVHVP